MIYGRGALIVIIMIGALFLGTLFFRVFDYQADITRIKKEFLTLEDRVGVKAGNWVHYLETRVNRVAQTQDEYQASTSRRIDLLEERIRRLEKEIKEKDDDIKSLKKRVEITGRTTPNE
jgi:predicted RNase H-like nuclease (RuvC/YqgF family)